MGFFNRRKQNEEAEDFILDFAQPVENDTSTITPWDEREHKTAAHAMTIEEILNGTPSTDEDTTPADSAEDNTAPKQAEQENTVSEQTEEKAEELAADGIELIKVSFGDTAPVQKTETAEAAEKTVATPPRDDEPQFVAKNDHAETETVAPTADAAKRESEENAAREMMRKLREELMRETAAEQETEEITESEMVLEQPEQPSKEVEQPTYDTAVSTKKEIKLSPVAQELYDRMMAQRAHNALHGETKKAEQSAELTATGEVKTADAENGEKSVIKESEMPKSEPIIPIAPKNQSDNIADSIFDELSSKLENDTRTVLKTSGLQSGSLLNKCRSFVTHDDETTIDDIIHDAEQGARKRLETVYDDRAKGYDFSLFSDSASTTEQDTEQKTDEISSTVEFSAIGDKKVDSGDDGATREIKLPEDTAQGKPEAAHSAPTIPISDRKIKNLQYSLASDTVADIDIGATREIPNDGHITDPVKAQTIRMHLEKIAEADIPDDEPAQTPLHFTGVDEDELPDGDIKTNTEAPIVDDYASIEDAESVRTDIAANKASVFARFISTAVITAVLAIIDFGFKTAIVAASPTAYLLLNAVLIIAALLVNINTLKGLAALLTGAPDMDTPSALAATATALYALVTALGGVYDKMPQLAVLGTLSLCFNQFGKLLILNRTKRGFEVIANDDRKKAVTFVGDKVNAAIMAGGSVIGEAFIATGKEAKNITGYLHNAYSEDALEKKIVPITVFTLIASAIFALLGFVFGKTLYAALVGFCAVLCAACPVSLILTCTLPFAGVAKKLSYYGAMIAGWCGVETVANTNAVAFDSSDLFPAGTVKLYNMQVLNRGAVDKYIADAAAVLNAAKSPLAPIFNEILETDSKGECPVADSVKYENGMGVSGWIEDRRIFVGNRTLMEGHSIRTPALELDKKILRQGYFPVYLAVDQQLCALFIVGYEADEEITYELRRLCSTGVTMLVRSNDPNISEEMLCDYFGLYADSVKMLSPAGVSAYFSATAYKESICAQGAYNGDICGFLSIVSSAIKLKSLSSALLIIQIVMLCLGIALCGYFTVTASLLKLPVLLFGGFQLLTAAVTAVVASAARQ